jgi:hypothetical protein
VSVRREGTVRKRLVAPGSKSEREAVVLETDAGSYVLRRRGGNPFRDPELEKLVGKRIRAHADELGQTLVLDAWDEL